MSPHLRWLVTTAAVGAALMGAIEANYRFGFRCPRNEVDAKLRELEQVGKGHFRALLFSDSTTHNAARSYRMSDDVLDLTTTNVPTLLGIKFMLQRFYEAGGTAEQVVVFFRPEFFNGVPALAAPGIFLWFNRSDELAELARYGVTGYVPYEIYMRNRLDALNVTNYFLTRSRLAKIPFDGQYTLERGVVTDHLHNVGDDAYRTTAGSRQLAHSMVELCKLHGTRLTYVLEPLTREDHLAVPGSELEKFLTQLAKDNDGVRYVDGSGLGEFTDEAFFDGFHPRQNWGKYYLTLIDRDVTPLFPHGS
jgi:hypothetical protein